MTSIIIVTYNNLALTKQCLESLIKYTAGNFEVIIVDNGSTKDVVEYLEQVEKELSTRARVIYNKENIGFVKANNQGILSAQGEYICLCNNDLVFTFNWLLRLKRCLESHPQCGMVGPYSNYVSGRQQVQIPQLKTPQEAEEFAMKFSQKEQPIDRLVFFCVLIRAELFKKDACGLLDTDFGMGNFEDDYMCWLAIKAEWKLRIANCFIWHIGSQSFRKDPVAFGRLLGRNQKIFYRKTGREIKISLCLVVGDYEKPETLKRCLDSIAPFVDEVCINFTYRRWRSIKRWKQLLSVVIDSAEISQGDMLTFNGFPGTGGDCAPKVWPRLKTDVNFHFTYEKWRWDFSYHRNKSKELATGQWIIWLDTADTFDSGLLLRKYVVHNDSTSDFMFMNIFAPTEDKVTTQLRHARLLRNKPLFFWQKPIHEDIVLSLRAAKGRQTATDLIVTHHGYKQKGSTFAKNIRNYKIMRKHVVGNPNADSLDFFHLANTYILLGTQFKKRKWWLLAIKAIDQCLNIPLKVEDPLWPKMVFLKGRVYHEIEEFDEAKRWYSVGIREKNYIESHLGMAEVLVTQKNYEAAIGHLDIIQKIGMDTGINISSVPMNLRELEEATFYNLGVCHFNLEHYKAAKEALQKCVLLNRERLLAIDLLCECLKREGNYGLAFNISLQAINNMPGYVNGWASIGAFELLNKRQVTARVFLREALRLNPKHRVAKKNMEMIGKK